jgi:hypothetical protein
MAELMLFIEMFLFVAIDGGADAVNRNVYFCR